MAPEPCIAMIDLDDNGVDRAFRQDVLNGLSQPQKAIPARWFYDEAGSRLFEDITRLPEYYPTRAETEILRDRAGEFAELIGPGRAVVEFGSGSSLKTPLLLQAIAPAAYVPLDISGDFLRQSARALSDRFPDLSVMPMEADFMKPVSLPPAIREMSRLGFFPGSTIGNLTASGAVDLLRSMHQTLGAGSQLLIGMDLIKDRATLKAAYNDTAGVTAAFNRNLAHRINRELGGTIPVGSLDHVVRWNDAHARIEMHLSANRDIAFEVSGRCFTMRRGETIHTENSHKYDLRCQSMLLDAADWSILRRWTDGAGRFSLLLAEAVRASSAP